MIRSAFHDLNRLRQIALIAGKYGFADLLERSGLWTRLGKKEQIEENTEVTRTQSVARRFRLFLSDLGPTFVKLGQVLSTRGDLLPAEYIDELSVLQDQAPPVTMDVVRGQIQKAFGRPLEELFSRFDAEPLAAASMAQVHRACTIGGDEVVVKVQRPDITETLQADISVLHSVARMLEAVIEEVGVYTPTGIVEEFDRAIREELDFLAEAGNIRAFYANHRDRPGHKVPKVYDELTSRTVLTMEFIQAPKLSAATMTEEDKKKLATIIMEGAFQQLFEDGLFHGDPHPGNLLILPGPVLAMIDFGLVGRVSRQMQDTLINLVLAIALKDSESAARILYRMGTPDARCNLMAFKADIDGVLHTYLPTSLKDIDTRHLLRDLLDLAVTYKIRIPREYAILTRAAIALEGIIRSLYADMPVGDLFLPYAKRLLAERYDPAQLQDGLFKTVLRMQSTLSELPMQMSQIMLDLESGKFTVTVKADQMQELNNNLRALALIVFAGMCAAGFIVGTFISFANKPWEIWGVPLMGILGVTSTIFLFSTAVVRQGMGMFRKVSLKRMLKK